MKLRILIGNLLFLLGLKPKTEKYSDNNELIGAGYIQFKNKSAYHYGHNAYLFPTTLVK